MRDFLLLIVAFQCITASLLGQSAAIDSLKAELSAHPEADTVRAEILLALGNALRNKTVDSARMYGKEALLLSESLQFQTGIGSAHSLLGKTYYYKGDYEQAVTHYAQALEMALRQKIPMRIASSHLDLAAAQVRLGKREEGKDLYLQGLPYAEQSGHKGIFGEFHNRLATLYELQGQYDTAIGHYQTAIVLKTEAGEVRGLASIYHNLGTLYYTLGDYLSALEYQQKALKTAQENNYQTLTAPVLVKIGKVYMVLEDFPKAIGNFREAVDIYQQIGRTGSKVSAEVSLAHAFQKTHAYDSARHYYQKALLAAREMNAKSEIANSLAGLGELALSEGNAALAIELGAEALAIRQEMNATASLPSTEMLIGKAYLDQGKLPQAEQYLSSALEKAKEMGSLTDLNSGYSAIYRLYQAQGRYQKALEAHIGFKATSDSLLNERNIRELTTREKQYEFDKEKAVIELENQQKQLAKEQELKEQRYILIGTSGGLFFMFVLAVISYRSYRLKQRANQQLTTMNEQISEQKEEILQQAEELKTSNEKLIELDTFKEDMTGMLVHDLKNPLNTIVHSVKEYTPENNLKISQASHQLHNMVLNILDVYKYENSQMLVEQSEVNLHEMASQAIADTSLLAANKSIRLTNSIHAGVMVKADREIMVRVFANLLTNAIKYTPQNGTITLSAQVEGAEKVTVKVADSGKGIAAENLGKIFDRFAQLEAKKSGSMRSTGLGLTFCKMAVEAHKGEIWVESEVGKGTTFLFTLPLAKVAESKTVQPSIEQGAVENPIELSSAEKEALAPIVAELAQTLVFEVGKVKAILKKIQNPTEAIKKWENEVNQSILTLNETTYQHLLEAARYEQPPQTNIDR